MVSAKRVELGNVVIASGVPLIPVGLRPWKKLNRQIAGEHAKRSDNFERFNSLPEIAALAYRFVLEDDVKSVAAESDAERRMLLRSRRTYESIVLVLGEAHENGRARAPRAARNIDQQTRARRPRIVLLDGSILGEVVVEVATSDIGKVLTAKKLWDVLKAELERRGTNPVADDRGLADKAMTVSFDIQTGRRSLSFTRFCNLVSALAPRRKNSR